MAVLRQQRRAIGEYGPQPTGLAKPEVERTVGLAVGKLTRFGTHLDAWAKAATVAPKTPDEYFSTEDRRHVVVGAVEAKFWRSFCQAAGNTE